jgi:hypothetical protein
MIFFGKPASTFSRIMLGDTDFARHLAGFNVFGKVFQRATDLRNWRYCGDFAPPTTNVECAS